MLLLAYYNSVFHLFVVGWIAFASGFTRQILKEMGSIRRTRVNFLGGQS